MNSEMENNIQILCTRPIGDSLIEKAKQIGVQIDVLPFIETEPIENIEVQQEIEATLILSVPVVFTSMNAVEAVVEFLQDDQPDWQIYCIGNTTKELAIKYFGESSLAATAASASELADRMIADNITDEVIFFCGDRRRDELPDKLRAAGIDVTEIIVYQTISVPHKVTKKYKGILFFSPSAVDSFFSVNKITSDIILFAIGITTADEIRKFAQNKVIIGEEPGKENLFWKMVEYFTG